MLWLSDCIYLINCFEDDCEAEVILLLQVQLCTPRVVPRVPRTSPHSWPSIVINLNKQGAILLLAVNVVDVPLITCLCNKNLDPHGC